MDYQKVNKELSKYIHNEDFKYYLQKLSSDLLEKEEEKFIKKEIFNIPFLDVLIINTKFSNFIEEIRREYKVNDNQREEWRDYDYYEKQYPKVIRRINDFLNNEFPKLNGLAIIFVTFYLFENIVSSLGTKEVLSRDPLITHKKHIDPITKKCDIVISYSIEGNTSSTSVGLSKARRQRVLEVLELPEGYFKEYKNSEYRNIGQRYILYILKNKLDLNESEIDAWFSQSNLAYIPPKDFHYSQEFKLLMTTFS
jgi:hypothetical protein